MKNSDYKILLVDDEPDIIEFVSYNLKKEGFDVLTASNGEDGLAMAKKSHPHLILLDVMMPKMSGFEVCRAIKGDESLRDIPVVMVTALDSVVDQDRAKSEGADGYMVKPIDRDELRAEVCSRLQLEA